MHSRAGVVTKVVHLSRYIQGIADSSAFQKWFCIGCLVMLSSAVQAQEITTFILVRHAEKVLDGDKDPSLTEEGIQRALRLKELLAKTSINAIYSTRYKRTRGTVQPLATSVGLSVREYEPRSEEAIAGMLKEHAGKTVLVCGHSDTVPQIANWLTGTTDYQEFDETDYGNVIIISVAGKGPASVTWLRY